MTKKNNKNKTAFELKSDFSIITLITCIFFDIADTGFDWLESLITSLGIGSGIASGASNTLDYIMVVAGFLIFYTLDKYQNISAAIFVPVALEPIIDEALPIPGYTGIYILTVLNGMRNR